MKKIYILAFVIVSALLASGCVREEVRDNEGSKGEVVFRVSLDGLTTKTTTPGEGAENTVSSLDFIIFQSDGTFLYKWHDDAPTPTTAGYYEQTAKVSTFGGNTAILQKAKTLAIANYPGDGSVFASKTLAQVQALAMVADNGTTNDASTGKFIYALADGSYQTLTTPSFVMTSTLGSFDKEADDLVSELNLHRLAAKVTLTLNYVYDPNDPEGTAITTPGPTMNGHSTTTLWMPMIGDNTRVYLDNGALDATLNGLAATPGVFRYADNHPSYDTNTTNPFYTYPLSWTAGSDRAPFIKIIQPWHYVTVDNDDPTHPVLDENVVELYYKVMFPGITMLESNTWYHPTVTLDVLGGEADDPVELTGIGMYILGWGDVPSTGAGSLEDINLEPAKYLVPECHEITVHNGNGAIINYVATSKPTVTVNAIYKNVYTNYSTATKYIYDPTDANLVSGDDYSNHKSADVRDTYSLDWFTNTYDTGTGKGAITLNHTLSAEFFESGTTTFRQNFAACPYTYELTLSMAGVNSQNLTITQYPPFSIEGQMSTGWVSINDFTPISGLSAPYRAREDGDENGNIGAGATVIKAPNRIYSKMYYTGSSSSLSQNTALGSARPYQILTKSDGKNLCRWRIIIKPAASPSTSVPEVYLLDPRTNLGTSDDGSGLYNVLLMHATNASSTSPSDGPALLSTRLTNYSEELANLKLYRPTKRVLPMSDDADKPMVLPGTAPEYMVASSYGKTVSLSYASAVARCAAYQEDGFPAGRWRVPTETEIYYAIMLSELKAIPNLFDGKYWASSGRYFDSTTNKWVKGSDEDGKPLSFSDAYATGVRCVYDTWYWGDDETNIHSTYPNLRTANYGNYTYPQYNWSGYKYISK